MRNVVCQVDSGGRNQTCFSITTVNILYVSLFFFLVQGIILFFPATLLSFSESFALEGPSSEKPSVHADLRIDVLNGFISLDVTDADLGFVLTDMARKARVNLTVDENLREKITAKIRSASFEETLKRICENKAIVFEYVQETNTYRIIRAWVPSAAKGHDGQGGNPGGGRTIEQSAIPSSSAAPLNPQENIRMTLADESRVTDSRGRRLYKPGEIIVKIKPETSENDIQELHRTLQSEVLGAIGRIRLYRIRLRVGLSENEAVDLYTASGLVEVAEKHALRYPQVIPNDPYYNSQQGLPRIFAPGAWDLTEGNPEVIIAVIDTGIDYLHPDLAENMWINPSEIAGAPDVDDDGNGYRDDIYGWDFAGASEVAADDQDADPMDVDGHGTHVAGILGARGDNGTGVAGVCWYCKIMPLKVQADDGEALESFDVIQAIDYAIRHGARVVNCSFGGELYAQSEYDAFSELRGAGILVAAAAGNSSVDTDVTPNYPSCYDLDNIISVAASNDNDRLAYFSSFGAISVDVMAPGNNIRSTLPAGAYTEALVKVQSAPDTTTYTAIGMAFAGTTGENGVTGFAYNCGKGYADEFPNEIGGNIALIERGNRDGIPFYFSQKTGNAQNAGAVGTIIFNNLDATSDDGFDVDGGTLGAPGDWIPVVSIPKADGEALRSTGSFSVTLVNRVLNDPASYGPKSGTSMAAPHVAGIAGLIFSKTPDLDYATVRSAILNTVDPIPLEAQKVASGGRVNALAALCGTNTVPGDLSFNGQVGVEDAIIVLQLAVSPAQAPVICPVPLAPAQEVNGNQAIGLEEAIYVLQKTAGLR